MTHQPTQLPQPLLGILAAGGPDWTLPYSGSCSALLSTRLSYCHPEMLQCWSAKLSKILYTGNLIPIPTLENTLLLFAAYLALSDSVHTSIKVYFSAIGNLHSSHSQHDAYHKVLTPHLEQVLCGIKREQSSSCTESVCLPITVEVMHQIYSVWSRSPAKFQGYHVVDSLLHCILWFSFSWKDDHPKLGYLRLL